MKARDTQKSKVYSLSFGPTCQLPLASCGEMVERAYSVYGRKWTGRVHDGGGRRSASGSYSRVSLPKWSRTSDTVLHEAAHGIMQLRFDNDLAWHGPEFVRVWMNLLEAEGIVKAPVFRAAAKAARVKISPSTKYDRVPARKVAERDKIVARINAARVELDAANHALAEWRKTSGI